MSLIITFMFEPAKLQMNWARANGMSTLRRLLDWLGWLDWLDTRLTMLTFEVVRPHPSSMIPVRGISECWGAPCLPSGGPSPPAKGPA
jgi:hypothetical protein